MGRNFVRRKWICLWLAAATSLASSERPEKVPYVFPAALRDIDGKSVEVERLAKEKRLVIVTLKATWCSVCVNQLVRLNRLLPQLESCGATFVVLSPGPQQVIAEVRQQTRFPYPFVEDPKLDLAKKLDLVLGPDQIRPAIFVVNKEREMVWMQYGRSGTHYGDDALMRYLGCGYDLTGLEGERLSPLTTTPSG